MMMLIGRSFVYAALGCLAISLLLLIKHRKELPSTLQLLGYCLLWSFLIEISAKIFIQLEINNLPLLHLYTLGEFLLWSLFYQKVLLKRSATRKLSNYFIFGILLLLISNSLFIEDIWGFNSYAKTLVSSLIIGYAIFYQARLLNEASPEGSASLTLINSGVLIYYTGSFLIFLFSNYFLKTSTGLPIVFWVFNSLLNLIFQIIILRALWSYLKNRNYLSSSL